MLVCGIDVGYRHLAFCLFEIDDAWHAGVRASAYVPPVRVAAWHMIDLLDGQKATGPVTASVDALVDHIMRPGSALRRVVEQCSSGMYLMEQQVGQGNQKMYAFSACLRGVLRYAHKEIHGAEAVVQVLSVTPARKALQGLERMFGDWAPVRDHPPGYGRAPPKTTTAYTRQYYKAKSIAVALELTDPGGVQMPEEDNVAIDKRDDLADALVVAIAYLLRAEMATTTAGRKHKALVATTMGRALSIMADTTAIVASKCM